MRVSIGMALGTLLLTQPVQSALAQTATFDIQPIIVSGSSQVAAMALNDHGTIVGVFTDSKGVDHGFALAGKVVTTLPSTASSCAINCLPVPTAINNAGDIVGYGYDGSFFTFLFRGTSYVPAGKIYLGNQGQPFVGLTNRGLEFFNEYLGAGAIDFAGPVGSVAQVTPPGGAPVIRSVNDKGVIAGSGLQFGDPVFAGKPGHFIAVTPAGITPNGSAAYGGYINNAGQVAGVIHGAGQPHGFVYTAGVMKTFSMPAPASNLQIAGINLQGRVAGYFTDISNTSGNAQRIFLYNGTTVSTFGAFPIGDVLQLAFNDNNVILVYDLVGSVASHGSSGTMKSYRVTCRGAGC